MLYSIKDWESKIDRNVTLRGLSTLGFPTVSEHESKTNTFSTTNYACIYKFEQYTLNLCPIHPKK